MDSAHPTLSFVHEDLTVQHRVGSAKYLEIPARIYQAQIAAIVAKNLQNKESIETAVRRAGDYLLAMSKPFVPVLTGFLRNSGYVKVI